MPIDSSMRVSHMGMFVSEFAMLMRRKQSLGGSTRSRGGEARLRRTYWRQHVIMLIDFTPSFKQISVGYHAPQEVQTDELDSVSVREPEESGLDLMADPTLKRSWLDLMLGQAVLEAWALEPMPGVWLVYRTEIHIL